MSGFPKQTVAKQGSLVFCVSKSSEAERERFEPLERMSVLGGEPDTDAHSNGKAGLIQLDLRSTLSSKGLESDDG